MIRLSNESLWPPVRLSKKSIVIMGLFMLLYIVAAVICLIQWGAPNPWSRLDVFSISYLCLAALLGLEQLGFASRLPGSEAMLGEALGATYDPRMVLWTSLLAIAELAVFIDYGHLHLMTQLEKPPLQMAGLVLCMLTIIWLRWVDAHLARHFASGLESRNLIVTGPYRYLRHPKYTGMLMSRIGFSLAIPSVLAWVLVVGWFLAVRRRIKLEEKHLDGIFGAPYSDYASRTSGLIPGLY